MQKRKSPTGPRNACSNCTKRPTKCDEQGTPCLQCLRRREAGTCARFRTRNATAPAALSRPQTSLSTSPSAFSSTTERNRPLELELMHRWSTRTWTCQAFTPKCQRYLTEQLPRAALGNSYLLNAIYAAAALGLSHSWAGTPSVTGKFIRAVREYASKAITDFRTQVTVLTSENIALLWYSSSLVASARFAMSAYYSKSIIDRICDHNDMALASHRALRNNIKLVCASSSPLAMRGCKCKSKGFDSTLLDALDDQTKVALALLSCVSDLVRVPAPSPTIPGSAVAEAPFANSVSLYQKAIGQTQYCFAEDLQRPRGYARTVFYGGGADLVQALRDRQPMAVFIFMYYGVLVHREGEDPGFWTPVSQGQEVVSETSELLLGSGIVDVPGVREGIAWTRSQVGLPALPGCPLPSYFVSSGIVDGEDTLEPSEAWIEYA
ncbi:hypothetical protein B0T16DRAFT_453340 [Cercophora newfieldiana]|uniref:Zn(2)-C6 fungal-type domain-containing protein n=1 Tax=Cercophora newfieldiana TaxID=92897 RepID=A0AA39YTK0_9PEZI|nr:hypothetical protein B0T16DRAFT_453340 [Cercophora newfieldiana]